MEKLRSLIRSGAWPSQGQKSKNRAGEAGAGIVPPNVIALPRIRSDDPICTVEEDVLGRQHLARAIAETIRELDTRNGAVVAIAGPWGSGKSSLICLTRNELVQNSSIVFLEFNPWLFSRTDDLIERFFTEIGEQLNDVEGRLSQIATAMAAYGEALAPMSYLPFIGMWSRAAKDTIDAWKKIEEHRKGGALGKRNTLVKLLGDSTQPIVVAIDDIDRLSSEEIRDIFKLVRLTGSFPNIVYLLAFDRARVESALDGPGLQGREYLEKIVQVLIDIPALPDVVLHRQLDAALSEAIQLATGAPMNVTERLIEVFHEILKPNFRHMRDVRRYVATIPVAIRSLEGRIALEDVLALEAIRLFHPDLFAWILKHRRLLSYVKANTFLPMPGIQEEHTRNVQALLQANPERTDLIKAMISTLFPLAEYTVENVVYDQSSLPQWQIEHRVAHPQFLALYLERIAGQELAAYWFAEEATLLIGDLDAFVAQMLSISDEERVVVVEALQALAQNVSLDLIVPSLVGVLNLADTLPKFGKPTARLVGEDPRRELRILAYRLISLKAPSDETEAVVRAVLPQVPSMGARLMLLNLVGHRENAGHKLVAEDVSAELESELREQIRLRVPSDLATERNILWTLMWAKDSRREGEPAFELPADPNLRCAILKDGVSRSIINFSQEEFGLAWPALLEMLGGEDEIRKLTERCQSSKGDPELALAIELATKYLSGWSPPHS